MVAVDEHLGNLQGKVPNHTIDAVNAAIPVNPAYNIPRKLGKLNQPGRRFDSAVRYLG